MMWVIASRGAGHAVLPRPLRRPLQPVQARRNGGAGAARLRRPLRPGGGPRERAGARVRSGLAHRPGRDLDRGLARAGLRLLPGGPVPARLAAVGPRALVQPGGAGLHPRPRPPRPAAWAQRGDGLRLEPPGRLPAASDLRRAPADAGPCGEDPRPLMRALAPAAPALLRAERLWHTLRHTPPAQLLRRAELRVRPRLAPRLAAQADPAPTLAAAPPLSPFPPRSDRIARRGGGWRLALPWGAVELPDPLPWRPVAGTPEAAAVANNLQYMEFVESLDNGALASIVADWIDANPLAAPGAVGFPWRPYNLSLRVSAWARELARRGDRFEPAFRARIAGSLAAQLRFLAGHLETDLRGNHLIKNLKALLWGGAVFAGPEAEAWRTLGSSLLASELEEQVLADGCHYERAPPYYGQVLADLIEVRALLPAGSLRDRLDEALGRMVSVAQLLAHPDGLP